MDSEKGDAPGGWGERNVVYQTSRCLFQSRLPAKHRWPAWHRTVQQTKPPLSWWTCDYRRIEFARAD